MQQAMCRERRSWTEEEDELLRNAVKKEDPDGNPPSKWHQIAKHVPNRTNKDCRKRWFAKMASVVAKGGWSTDEDERLIEAVRKYGTKWSLVAAMVQTRNNDQCAKRWSDTLNPEIDRTVWSPEEDTQLLEAVQSMGKSWTKIVKTYFPGRTGLSAKNRYSRLMRISADSSKGIRTRRRSTSSAPYPHRHRSPTSASSCSDTASRVSPAIDPSFPCIADVPECPPTSVAASSTLDCLTKTLTIDTPEMKVAESMLQTSLPPEFLNMATQSDSSASPSTSSESCPSLDALMNELSASLAFDPLAASTHLQSPNSSHQIPIPQNFPDPGLFDIQIPWPTESLASTSTHPSIIPTPQSLPGTPFEFHFPPLDTFPASLPITVPQSPSSLPSLDPLPSSSSAPSSVDVLSPLSQQSPKELDQQDNDTDNFMAMLRDCPELSDFQMEGTNSVLGSRVDPSRTENRMAVAVAVAMCEPREFQNTVHTLVNGLWGSLCPPVTPNSTSTPPEFNPIP